MACLYSAPCLSISRFIKGKIHTGFNKYFERSKLRVIRSFPTYLFCQFDNLSKQLKISVCQQIGRLTMSSSVIIGQCSMHIQACLIFSGDSVFTIREYGANELNPKTHLGQAISLAQSQEGHTSLLSHAHQCNK